jgi:hypothetical protein
MARADREADTPDSVISSSSPECIMPHTPVRFAGKKRKNYAEVHFKILPRSSQKRECRKSKDFQFACLEMWGTVTEIYVSADHFVPLNESYALIHTCTTLCTICCPTVVQTFLCMGQIVR